MASRLLITGAAGTMGTLLRPRLARAGRVLRLLDVIPINDPDEHEEPVIGSVLDSEVVAAACEGVEAVVHLAGITDEAPWPELVEANIHGTQSVLDAARAAGVSRVIVASSNHAVGFRQRGEAPLEADASPRPDTFYGFTKAAVEALGGLYADRFGMDVVCIRIGKCLPEPLPNARGLAAWLSPDDAARLVEACLAAPPFGFKIVWGISANTRRWWSLAEGAALGYQPVDNSERNDAAVLHADVGAAENDRVGGPFCDKPLGRR